MNFSVYISVNDIFACSKIHKDIPEFMLLIYRLNEFLCGFLWMISLLEGFSEFILLDIDICLFKNSQGFSRIHAFNLQIEWIPMWISVNDIIAEVFSRIYSFKYRLNEFLCGNLWMISFSVKKFTMFFSEFLRCMRLRCFISFAFHGS